ncbi:MAG: hypothetical protein KDK30_09110 [Leptospiraceae bacterium]|nr:hypothetical protein [Leptospiraceae bacterium]
MLLVYKINSMDLYIKHGENILRLLEQSEHRSVFSNESLAERDFHIGELIRKRGMMLYCVRESIPVGLLIAEVRNQNEFGVLEFCLIPGTADRVADVLFSQLVKALHQREFRGIYCNHDWILSVNNKAIADKFTIRSDRKTL